MHKQRFDARAGRRTPHWQLPAGVSRGTWDYLQSDRIATDYDAYFADSPIMRLDIEVLRRYLPAVAESMAEEQRPWIADLGCGTGRVARALLPLGYRMINVDLSQAMLREVASRTPAELSHRVRCVHANLVEIDQALEPESIDFAVCLFSSLGMIRGRAHRRRFLSGVRRALKPGGGLMLHVHNRWLSLRDPGGLRWLATSWLGGLVNRDAEFGDRVYAYRGLPAMFLHIYSRRELLADLRAADLPAREVLAIAATGERLAEPRGPLSRFVRPPGGFFALAFKN